MGVEVIDRDNLNTILREHSLNFSGYVDKNTALSIGNLIGPSAFNNSKSIKIPNGEARKLYVDEKQRDYKTKTDKIVRAYIARTTVYLKVSIQTTDLTTGRIFTARVLDYMPISGK